MLRRWRTRILLFSAVLGPGVIPSSVDNDSRSVLNYSLACAKPNGHLSAKHDPSSAALQLRTPIGIREGS